MPAALAFALVLGFLARPTGAVSTNKLAATSQWEQRQTLPTASKWEHDKDAPLFDEHDFDVDLAAQQEYSFDQSWYDFMIYYEDSCYDDWCYEPNELGEWWGQMLERLSEVQLQDVLNRYYKGTMLQQEQEQDVDLYAYNGDLAGIALALTNSGDLQASGDLEQPAAPTAGSAYPSAGWLTQLDHYIVFISQWAPDDKPLASSLDPEFEVEHYWLAWHFSSVSETCWCQTRRAVAQVLQTLHAMLQGLSAGTVGADDASNANERYSTVSNTYITSSNKQHACAPGPLSCQLTTILACGVAMMGLLAAGLVVWMPFLATGWAFNRLRGMSGTTSRLHELQQPLLA